MKRALITGITGQDGSYLAEILLEKGYKVYGMMRRVSNPNLQRIEHIKNKIELIYGDLTDAASLIRLVKKVDPHEVYNLAAMSFVPVSWQTPESTFEIVAKGVLNILEAIRISGRPIRFYQASSSEMFGKVQETPQTEATKFYPRSPYGIAKLAGHWITVNYRESFGIFACSGICFNHESRRRGEEFVSRKITRGAARIAMGLQNELLMGNIKARRDWGFAGDYCSAMHMMLQNDAPVDYVISTNETHSVQEFLELAFHEVNLNWEDYVRIDKELYRPAEVELLLGDSSKIRNELGWKPKFSFKDLVQHMMEHDIYLAQKEAAGGDE